MPTYEYKCHKCGHIFELFQSITSQPLATCESCGEVNVKRVMSAGSGIDFKGSGFYVTDYKSEKTGGNTNK